MTRVLVSFSGGMDSATVLADAIDRYGKQNVAAVGFCYGSKHNPFELAAAKKFTEHYDVPYTVIDAISVFSGMQSNLLASNPGEIPEGHYESESMRLTVVPGRNMIFAAVLAGVAESQGFDALVLGVHAGDHHIYPDCRPRFVKAMREAVAAASDDKVGVLAPFLSDNKYTILRRGYELGVPYALTRTCYKAQPISCGKCGSCQERLEAFARLGIKDPLEYEDSLAQEAEPALVLQPESAPVQGETPPGAETTDPAVSANAAPGGPENQ